MWRFLHYEASLWLVDCLAGRLAKAGGGWDCCLAGNRVVAIEIIAYDDDDDDVAAQRSAGGQRVALSSSSSQFVLIFSHLSQMRTSPPGKRYAYRGATFRSVINRAESRRQSKLQTGPKAESAKCGQTNLTVHKLCTAAAAAAVGKVLCVCASVCVELQKIN